MSAHNTSEEIDLQFRPASYFGQMTGNDFVLTNIHGTQRRAAVNEALSSNQLGTVPEEILHSALSPELRSTLGSIHPAFLGGEFLPEQLEGEIEIARVTLDSVTSDVTSVYAKYSEGLYLYCVVDEYEGETLSGPDKMTSQQPLTLGELITFLDTASPLMEILEMNYEGNLKKMLGFFVAESAFYPDLDRLYRKQIRSAFSKASEE